MHGRAHDRWEGQLIYRVGRAVARVGVAHDRVGGAVISVGGAIEKVGKVVSRVIGDHLTCPSPPCLSHSPRACVSGAVSSLPH